jgi:two-component system chemotaxis response regulator CheB
MISVLIADDSALVREVLRDIVDSEPDMQVIGEASDGKDAVEKARVLQPDLITMDVLMPGMDGLAAIEEIMAHYPTPILVFSSAVNVKEMDIAFQAISRGALDVMGKPSDIMSANYETVRQDLLAKIRLLSRIRVIAHVRGKKRVETPKPKKASLPAPAQDKIKRQVVAFGASTGGPRALVEIFRELPANIRTPLLIVQHIAPSFAEGMAEWLTREARLKITIATDGQMLRAGEAYLAPTDQHLVVEKNRIHLSQEDPVNACRPSVDVLFDSVANYYGDSSVAVLLTGMGRDGAEGMKKIHDLKGYTIVQDESTSVIFGMPKAAIDAGAVDEVLPLAEIPAAILRVLGK